MSLTVRSFAKINLGLYIGARRQDGFHDLLTVYQTVDLYDVIRMKIERGRGIEIRCSDSRVPTDESNTCYRLVEKAMSALGVKGRVVIEIEKLLPVQGGLAGASSNAVAALVALERVLKKRLAPRQRLKIASEVGSDLPFFLIGGTALGISRGEQVYPLQDLPAVACVVLTPQVGVSTPKAFAAWDHMYGTGTSTSDDISLKKSKKKTGENISSDGIDAKLTAPQPSIRMGELGMQLSAWLSDSVSGAPRNSSRRFRRGRAENPLLALVRTGIQNDFEQVVFPDHPELSEAKRALERAGATYASLSGSGSALYGLFGTRELARRAAERLKTQGWEAKATTTLTRAQYSRRFIR